jgi:hypothetical protein
LGSARRIQDRHSAHCARHVWRDLHSASAPMVLERWDRRRVDRTLDGNVLGAGGCELSKRVSAMSDNTKIVPFGKYKGKPVEAMAADRQYLDWLTAQPWFRETFANLYTVVINNFSEPTETPEHNELQAKFLSDEFCLRFLSRINRRWFGRFTRTSSSVREFELWWDHKDFTDRCGIHYQKKFDPECDRCRARAWEENLHFDGVVFETLPITKKLVGRRFECGGVDVVMTYLNSFDNLCFEVEIEVGVEVKPYIGDDYPAVLRQMRANGAMVLLLREYIEESGRPASSSSRFSRHRVFVSSFWRMWRRQFGTATRMSDYVRNVL